MAAAGTATRRAGSSRTGEPPRGAGRRHPVRPGRRAPVHEEMVAPRRRKNIWLVGGGELVGAFADQGLLDEVLLGMQPVFLGAGAPLLPRVLTSKRVRLESARKDGQQVLLLFCFAKRDSAGAESRRLILCLGRGQTPEGARSASAWRAPGHGAARRRSGRLVRLTGTPGLTGCETVSDSRTGARPSLRPLSDATSRPALRPCRGRAAPRRPSSSGSRRAPQEQSTAAEADIALSLEELRGPGNRGSSAPR